MSLLARHILLWAQNKFLSLYVPGVANLAARSCLGNPVEALTEVRGMDVAPSGSEPDIATFR